MGSVSHACSVFLPVSLLCNARFESIVLSVGANNRLIDGTKEQGKLTFGRARINPL